MPDAQAIVVRAPTPTDLAAVVELINACSLAVGGVPDMTPAMLRADWTDPNFAPETDAWLALTADGRVVGYETVYLEGAEGPVEVDGYVLPEQQGRGIGTRLLRLAEARARSLRAQGLVLRGTIEAASGGAQQLFAAEGYRCVRHFARMEIELAAAPPAPEWPAGMSVRPFVLAHDARATHAVVEQAFQDHWGHTPVAFDAWRQSLIERDDFDPALWFLACQADAPVGVVLGYTRSDTRGWVRNLSVLRPWRGRGLGMALLRHAFGAFFARGIHTIGLGVDAQSPTGATRLYERAGMRVIERYDTMEKRI